MARGLLLAGSTLLAGLYFAGGALTLKWMVTNVLAAAGGLALLTYVLPALYLSCSRPQDLKKKYNAEWALVTGASSGIGRALAERLAQQGINCVLVALDDPLLQQAKASLSSKYPKLQFRAVGANLSQSAGGYMKGIVDATADIPVSLVFNNAGYMVTGFFRHVSIEQHLANIECNATSAVRITHHFLQQMITAKRKGAVCFTSSVAGFIPSPFAVCYGSTKAFLSSFAASLAIEAKYYGVDICAVHPSPVSSRFLDKADKNLDSFQFAYKFACGPDELPDTIFATIGRATWRDVGGFAFIARLVTKLFDFNLLAGLFAANAHHMKDWETATKQK